MKPTGFVFHEDYLRHETGDQVYSFKGGKTINVGNEFENPLRAQYIKEMLDKSGLLTKMKSFRPHPASDTDLLRVHSQRHIVHLKEACQKGDRILGPEVYGCHVSEEIARLSAGGAIKAVDIAMKDEEIRQVYALIRPPGHHASRDQAMGFCLYNNVAVAARYAIDSLKLKRVAILDWDVHHGNGTQDIFYHDNNVLFISVHEAGYFPANTGSVDELGVSAGKGYNVNIPLPSGTGDAGYLYTFERLVQPIINEYQPELLLVSAGQDPSGLDPLSRMMVMRPGFRSMAKAVRELADKICDGRLVVLQEGGYSLPYLPIATLGVIEGLMDCEVDFHDPHAIPNQPITYDLVEAVTLCEKILAPYWNSLCTPAHS
ncbi:class II histone deacetylase [Pseudalkalibacillus decolorationis]|uniref:class II histone deacetylase n=1 Tax=Pseudalkalibacillus decolorationis TaxID=163879 RepID=UPI00214846E5|nr:class II histone deacetylase [Pseudalkalibacillus decolorationis]